MTYLLPSERARLNRQAAVRAGQKFVLVDTSVPGGKWIDEIIYDSSREADREAAKLKSRYPKVQVIDATWYVPSDEKLKALGMKAAADKVADLPDGTVAMFLLVASSKLTQYDARLQKKQPNNYRLGHYLGALNKVEADVSRYKKDDSPEALEALKKSLLRRFTSTMSGVSQLAPIRNVIKQIDAYLAAGQLPSLTRRASAEADLLPIERARLAARLQGEDLYNALKKIVDEKQYAKINGQMVDLFSASAMVQVADALNERNRDRFLGLPLAKAHSMAFKMMKTGSKRARFSEGPEGEIHRTASRPLRIRVRSSLGDFALKDLERAGIEAHEAEIHGPHSIIEVFAPLEVVAPILDKHGRPGDTARSLVASGKQARFPEGLEGEKAWKAWMKKQPQSFQDEWEKENEANKDKFTEESMMSKTDDAVILPVEVEMQRLAGKTAGRHERGLSRSTLDFLTESAAESADLDSRNAEASREVIQIAQKFESDLERALEAWVTKNPLAMDYDVDTLLDDGAAYLTLMTLRGEGVGIWDGDWDHYFTGGSREIQALGKYLEQKLGKYADDTGTGLLNEALDEAAYESAGEGRMARQAAGGLYGYTKRTQRDVEATVRKAQKQAVKIAQYLASKDDRSIPFLQAHAKRARSASARLVLSAMKSLGPKFAAKVAAGDQTLTANQSDLYDSLWFKAAEDTTAREARNAALAVTNAWEQVEGSRTDYRAIRARVASDVASHWTHQDRTASGKTGGIGLYGFPTKTARRCLSALTDFRAYVGEAAYGLHSRREAKWDRITGFMREHSKTARCGYTRILLGCYPDSPSGRMASEEPKQAGCENLPNEKMQQICEDKKKGGKGKSEKKDDAKSEKKDKGGKDKMPAELLEKFKGKKKASEVEAKKKAPPKEHQFTSEDNPNPKGNDRDGDGKTNEKKPFGDKKATLAGAWGPTLIKADFDPHEIGMIESGGALEEDADEASYMNENFTEQESAELLMKQQDGVLQDGRADGGPAKMAVLNDSVAGWLEWQE